MLLPDLTGIGCEHSHLFSITRSNEIVDFDIVILYFVDHFSFMKQYKPLNITTKKIMVVFGYESPFAVRLALRLQLSIDYFTHWVFSYYKSSYFYIPYGFFKKRDSRSREQKIRVKKKKKGLVAVISNCNIKNTVRLRYIQSLRKHVPISLYGHCFNHTIMHPEREKIISNHKFFLAFENSHCEDYNTEKYWHAILFGSIPIVMGYNKNLDHLIPGSYLDVFNFTNPKHLAQHLIEVMSNSKKEMSYHQWRKSYVANVPKFRMNGCEMLEKIYNFLTTNTGEDPTIHKLGNLEICMDPRHVERMIMRKL
ncbi:Alpha-(1,3)-fucosyltransferase 9 [Thelohanellus kitauei]|uniref:Fucosyltransferase n=1 Tax=Thelohanellus kitauei TaxID=669202 RepID=A0A0C2N402_THEKT|nr:Alpha-(1,3)-fucosyltransferase 9 [Thelohanellus kitauei]